MVPMQSQQEIPPPPVAQQFCVPSSPERAALIVDEDYVVIGQEPRTGRLYSGSLSVKRVGDNYRLVRKTARGSAHGSARPVLCGPDEVQLLEVRYETSPAQVFRCKLSFNYDNYSVASCGPDSRDGRRRVGLEAWYPHGAP
jgi:hypothetical protein